jgi:hypothetical protein
MKSYAFKFDIEKLFNKNRSVVFAKAYLSFQN